MRFIKISALLQNNAVTKSLILNTTKLSADVITGGSAGYSTDTVGGGVGGGGGDRGGGDPVQEEPALPVHVRTRLHLHLPLPRLGGLHH